jgi:rhodanese-related sulfurtransferase
MPVKTIDATTLNFWLTNGEAVLIDVRGPVEYAGAHIKGSHSLPVEQLALNTLPDFSGKKLVLQCNTGNRSGKNCEKLKLNNPNLEIYSLEGGINAWRAAGFNVVESGKYFLPLDRQVQLTIGLMVFLGSILGLIHSINWLYFTGFIGAGLMFAGLSGICFLANVISRMPWNRK